MTTAVNIITRIEESIFVYTPEKVDILNFLKFYIDNEFVFNKKDIRKYLSFSDGMSVEIKVAPPGAAKFYVTIGRDQLKGSKITRNDIVSFLKQNGAQEL